MGPATSSSVKKWWAIFHSPFLQVNQAPAWNMSILSQRIPQRQTRAWTSFFPSIYKFKLPTNGRPYIKSSQAKQPSLGEVVVCVQTPHIWGEEGKEIFKVTKLFYFSHQELYTLCCSSSRFRPSECLTTMTWSTKATLLENCNCLKLRLLAALEYHTAKQHSNIIPGKRKTEAFPPLRSWL